MGGITSLFMPKPPKQKSPTAAPPDPDEEGPIAKEARRKKVADAQQRGGRTSTILTGQGDYAGGALG